MKRLGLILIASMIVGASVAQKDVEAYGVPGKSYYLERDWGKLHYEVFGEGMPLLVLHGNSGSTKGKHHLFPDLTKEFKIIAVDNRCHGESECPDGDLDYFDLAEDVHELMIALGHEEYMIWGHSDGGILGLILGYKYTAQIDRMVISGANAKLSGLESRLIEIMSNYEKIPDPMMRKQVKLMVDQKEITMDNIRKVDVPVLLIVGDRDAVKMEHTIDLFNALPKANLCVLPGTTHFVDHERPKDLVRMIKEFKQPFKSPSTIDIAEKMAKSIFSQE